MWAHNVSGHGIGCQALRTPYIYSIYMYQRECGSTLYVELARTAPPTNTNFRLSFLLTRLQEALYEDLPVVYRAWNLKSTITFLALISERKSISGAHEKPWFLAIYS